MHRELKYGKCLTFEGNCLCLLFHLPHFPQKLRAIQDSKWEDTDVFQGYLCKSMLFLLALRDTESRQPHSSGASCLLFRILLTGRMETYWVKPSPHFRATQTSSRIYIEKVFYSFNSRSKTHLLKTLNTKEVYKEKGIFSSFFSPEKYIVILSFESISSNLLLRSKTIRIAWWLFPHVFVDVVCMCAHTNKHTLLFT